MKFALKALREELRRERAYLRNCDWKAEKFEGARAMGARNAARAARLRISDLEMAIITLEAT